MNWCFAFSVFLFHSELILGDGVFVSKFCCLLGMIAFETKSLVLLIEKNGNAN